MSTLLSETEVQQALTALPQWQVENKVLVRQVEFPSFLRGIEFINAVAHLAERQDHHPDIDIRYRKLRIAYWTHTVNGITEKDIVGAKEVETLIGLFLKLTIPVS